MAANGGEIVVDFTIDNGKAIVAVKQAGQTLQTLKQTLDTTANSVQKLEAQNSGLGRKFRDLVLTMGNLRFVAMDVNDVFLRLPMSILKTAGQLEQMQALMTGLSKEFTKVAREAEGLRSFQFVTEMAKTAPFEIAALSDAFVKFKSAGLDPTNGSMQALVDSVAKFGGSGDTLKRASVAIQQMVGKGVVSMEELRQQLGEAVPTAMKDMADQMGVSMAELAKMVQTGTLKAEPALNKMFLRMQVNNSGAAKEMMNTWVGMTAQLKTQWDLTAKLIADSGFSTEVKRVIDDLTRALSSPEGREAAIGFGHALSDAVTTLVSMGKFLNEHATLIKYAAEAWIAYKVATSVLAPLGTTIAGSISKVNASLTGSIAAQQRAVVAAKQAAFEEAQAAEQRAARVIQARIVEMRDLDRHNAEILAKQARLNAALAAQRTPNSTVNVPFGSGVPGLTGQNSAAEVKAAYAGLTKEMEANRVKGQQMVSDLAILRRQHAGLVGDVNNTNASLTRMSGVAGTLRSAVLGAGGAIAGGLKTAFLAMGGWVGVAIIAISALIGWMYKLKAASDEAAAAVARAKQDRSTKEDVDNARAAEVDAASRLERAKKASENLQAQMAKAGSQTLADKQRTLLAASQREEAAAAEALVAARTETGRRVASVTRQAAAEEAEAIIIGTKNATAAQRDGDRQRLGELQGANAQKLKDMKLKGVKEDSAAWKGEIKRAADEEAQYEIKSRRTAAEQTLAAANAQKAELAKLNASGAGGEEIDKQRSARQQAFNRLMDQYGQEKREVEQMTTALNGAIEGGTKKAGDKGGGKGEKLFTPIQRLTMQLRADRAELDAEVASFTEDFQRIDSAAAAGAKIREKAKPNEKGVGGFDYKKGKVIVKADPAAVERAAQMAEEEARLQTALKNAKKLTDDVNGMEGEYTRALSILADPLSLNPGRGQVGEFDDLLAKTGMSLKELAAALGMTGDKAEEFVSRMGRAREQAAVIDLAPQVQKQAEATRDWLAETQRINAEMIVDDQARVLALSGLDTELFRVKSQNLIDYLKLHGANNQMIADAEIALQANLVARREQAAKDARNPMQVMADQWADATGNMKKATADWAQQGMDAFITFARTGKLQWKDLVTDILAGLLKIETQKALSGLLGGSGSGSSGGGWIGALATIAGSFFADGGIMSSGGSLPLKKYAAGGIADSPQLAVFGEGRMKEAYVPLPDGRSIPVTMSMSGAGQSGGTQATSNVVVNVINQTSQQVQAQQQGQPRFDGKQMVLDVVLQAAGTPGPFRDGMKSAMTG